MFYRTLLTGIVLFWLVMTGLLLRIELFPDRASVVPVPPAYVARLVFMRQQTSDLVLYNNQRQRIGTLYLHPQTMANPEGEQAGDLNVLRGTGDAMANLPGVPNGRLTFSFSVQLNRAQQVQNFDWSATLHTLKSPQSSDPRAPGWGIKFEGQPLLNQYHYLIRRDNVVQKEASGTPAELLADPDLAALGFDPRMLIEQWEARTTSSKSGGDPASQMSITAHRGSLRSGGEEIETFVVTARYADSLESTMHVSQLGQVLSVKTFTGYNLFDEALTP